MMKNKLFITIIAVTLFAACEEDFMDPRSISTFNNEYIFSNVDDARNAVNAIYSHFNQDAFRSRLSNNMTGNTDIEHQSGWTSNADRYQIWNLEALTTNRDLDIVWTYAYRAIRDANIAIEGIQESGNLEASDENVRRTFNHLLGEAYTLRAYWYSMLIFHFGDVPYITVAPKAGADLNQPKTDRNVILTGVIQDMIDAEANMMWADQLPYGAEQVNREYTLGMIARLSLQRGGYFLTPELTMEREGDYLDYYQIAREYTRKLMELKDRQLPVDYRQIFVNQHNGKSPVNSDVLFEVPFGQGQGDVGWNIGVTVEGGPTASHDYGSGGNYMQMPISYYLSFDEEDKRREVTTSLYQINTDFQQEFIEPSYNIAQGKWNRALLDPPPGSSSAKGTGINWPMMRYSDVILMFAEAENEINGPTAEAQEALKRVRRRAFDDVDWPENVDQYVANVSTSKESFFEAIVDERAWEFGGEMIRKYELIRWGIYSEKVQETVEELKNLADAAFNGTTDEPIYMYWKTDEDGDFIIYNRDENVIAPPDDTWMQAPFVLSLHSDETQYQEFILKDWENYINGPQPGVVRYIFPIPNVAIENSRGVLQNDGYGF
ncbi:putative outer membrane starch-binding protein [Salegentibacter sp. 24]|jgi:hypothetical protein|uniref:RagB/SusD family nutrient uptake outer membrane protein n=1 Tax=Salegentibacter sp. 24 TaxID=2183986 RepID=UPI0010DA2B4A|nr:RagB/SusD family nutrient uptake outer membrane protein [Salegentibacter sp. 24]TDN95424.1 putative outer membrane starch-binding protein [Salegentibacter sp. 24]